MKSTFLKTLILAGSLALTGCDEQARDFAAKTLVILQHRSAEISKKIAAEKAAYAAASARDAEDHRALLDGSLRNERFERSTAFAADYDEGRKQVSHWRQDLAEYGKVDYDANMEVYAAELDSDSRFLQNFESLKLEQDKIDALTKLLGALAAKPSIQKDLEALGKFAEDSNSEYTKKVCTQIKTDQGSSDAKVKAAADAASKAKDCAPVPK
jgi:hypothetical protein